MKKRHWEADGFENSKVGPRDGTPDPPKKLSLVLPMSFPLQTVHSRYLSYDIYKHLREKLQMQLYHMSRTKTIPPETLPKKILHHTVCLAGCLGIATV